jgi:hypothetical protein
LKHPNLLSLTRHGIEKVVRKDCFLGTARGITRFRYLVPLLRNPPIHDEFLRDRTSRGDRSKDMLAATPLQASKTRCVRCRLCIPWVPHVPESRSDERAKGLDGQIGFQAIIQVSIQSRMVAASVVA